MARNAIPGLKTGGGIMSKLIGTAVLVAILVIVVRYPTEAAGFAKTLFTGAGAVIDGFVSFLRSLMG